MEELDGMVEQHSLIENQGEYTERGLDAESKVGYKRRYCVSIDNLSSVNVRFQIKDILQKQQFLKVTHNVVIFKYKKNFVVMPTNKNNKSCISVIFVWILRILNLKIRQFYVLLINNADVSWK